MNRSSIWKTLRQRVRVLAPGVARRELRVRAKHLGSAPAGHFADISNNSDITPAMIREYAKNHDVLVVKASEGKTWTDHKLAIFVKAAKDAGLIVAPYHFARPDNNDPVSEARHFVQTCRAAGLRMGPRRKLWYERDELPGVLDYEVYHPQGMDSAWITRFMREYRRLTNHGEGRWRGRKDEVTQDCLLYGGNIVRERVTGRINALYWLAAYTNSAAPFWPSGLPKKYRLAWQFTDKGRFKAFGSRDTDRNRFVGNLKLRDILGLAT